MNNLMLSNGNRPSVFSAFGGLDNFLDDVFRPVAGADVFVPAIDVTETENEYLVKADLPGVKKEDLDVSVADGVLTITAETRFEESEKENGRLLRQERRYGKYTRSMRLGKDVDTSKVKAEYKDGVLELKLAKSEEVKPKKIAIAVN